MEGDTLQARLTGTRMAKSPLQAPACGKYPSCSVTERGMAHVGALDRPVGSFSCTEEGTWLLLSAHAGGTEPLVLNRA
jgi:hypothetical protein